MKTTKTPALNARRRREVLWLLSLCHPNGAEGRAPDWFRERESFEQNAALLVELILQDQKEGGR